MDIDTPLVIWAAEDDVQRPLDDVNPIHDFKNQCGRVQDCAFAGPSSSSSMSAGLTPIRLVAAGTNHEISIFDYLRRDKLGQIQLDAAITSLTVSQDNLEILVNLNQDEVWLLGLEDGVIHQKFRGIQQNQYVIKSCFGGATESFVVSGSEGTFDSKLAYGRSADQ